MQINLIPDLSLVAVLVIFIINYLVVRRFFVQPVNQILEEREAEVKGADALYQQAITRYSEATAEIEAQVHAARRDAATRREAFRAEATAHRNSLVERTQAEAQQIVSSADAKLSQDVATARERIKSESESLAKLAAERILGRAV